MAPQEVIDSWGLRFTIQGFRKYRICPLTLNYTHYLSVTLTQALHTPKILCWTILPCPSAREADGQGNRLKSHSLIWNYFLSP
jgi:hypothetical protein